jgi:6-phosphogluconolactonase (cycloisomerase 2 family)/Ca2+-binding RTX toxin-like protein
VPRIEALEPRLLLDGALVTLDTTGAGLTLHEVQDDLPQSDLEQLLLSISPTTLTDGFESVVGGIIDKLEAGFEELEDLPLIGSKIAEGVDPFFVTLEDLRDDVSDWIDSAYETVNLDPSKSIVELLEQGWYTVFGPDMLGILRDGPDADSDISVADVVRTSGYSVDGNGDPIDKTEWVQWDSHLGQSYYFDLPFEFGLNIGALLSTDLFEDFGFGIDASDGIRIKVFWDVRLGFGISEYTGGFYLNSGAVDQWGVPVEEIRAGAMAYSAPPKDAFGNDLFSADPGISGETAMGLITGQVEDGTVARTTLSGRKMIEIGQVLETLDYSDDFSLTIIDAERGTHTFDISYQPGLDQDFATFLAALNVELNNVLMADVYSDVIYPPVAVTADFSGVRGLFHPAGMGGPSLVLTATTPDIWYMTLEGADGKYGFQPVQHEDFRCVGLGFGVGQESSGGAMVAEMHGPAGGVLTEDVDFWLGVGADRIRVVLRAIEHLDVTSLESLRGRVADEMSHQLSQAGLDPSLVTVSLHGNKFVFESTESLQVQYQELEKTKLQVLFTVDLVDPSYDEVGHVTDPDNQMWWNRLTYQELVGQPLNKTVVVKLAADAKLRFHVDASMDAVAGFTEQVLGLADGSLGLPELGFDLKLDASATLDSSKEEGKRAAKGIDALQFDNIALEVGSLLDNVFQPVVNVVGESLGPVFDIVGTGIGEASGWLKEPIPLLEDIWPHISSDDPPNVFDLIDMVPGASTGDLEAWFDIVVGLSEFPGHLADFMADYGGDPIGFGGWEFDVEKKILMPMEVASMIDSFDPEALKSLLGVHANPAGIKLEILEPASIVNMLIGEPFDIISVNLPRTTLGVDIAFGFDFKILEFSIDAFAGLTLGKLGIVYDSTGLERVVGAAKSGTMPDFLDLLDGLYIRNENEREVEVTLYLDGHGAVDVEIMSASADVHLDGSLYLDLLDPNDDGKIRLDEIFELTDNFQSPESLLNFFSAGLDIACSFDLTGEIAGQSISIGDLGFDPSFDVSLDLHEIFDANAYHNVETDGPVVLPDPILATEITEGGVSILRLNAGPYANNRIYGDTDDTGGADFSVTGTNGALLVSGVGIVDQPYNGTYDRILAVGTDDADTFDLSGVDGVEAEVHGAGGGDAISTGSGDDLVYGDAGDDTIFAGAGEDTVYGGDGSDTMGGGTGRNVLFGEDGDDEIAGGPGTDVAWGGAGDDTLASGGGNDELYGERGDDVLAVNRDSSGLLDGGRGSDTILFDEADRTVGLNGATLGVASLSVGGNTTSFTKAEQIEFDLGSANDELVIEGTDLPVVVRGAGGADELTVSGATAPLELRGGAAPAGSGDRLTVDLSAENAVLNGELSNNTLTGLGLGEITYHNFEDVEVRLGHGDDEFVVNDTDAGAETTIFTGSGDDDVLIRNIRDVTVVNGDAGYDTATVEMAGAPSAFADLGLGVEVLEIENSTHDQAVNWKYEDGIVYADGDVLFDALGAELVVVIGGSSAADGLIVSDTVDSPQAVTVTSDSVTIKEGVEVLLFDQTMNFTPQSMTVTVDGLDGPRASAVSPDGAFVYVVCDSDSGNTPRDRSLLVFRREDNGGLSFVQVVQHGEAGVDGLLVATDVAVSPDGKHVYVASAPGFYRGQIAVFQRVAETGRVFYRGVYEQDVPINGIAVHPDGGAVYAASEDAVVALSRDHATGLLTWTAQHWTEEDYLAVAVAPDGQYAYAVSEQTLELFEVSAGDFSSAGAAPLGGTDVAVSPDSQSFYVAEATCIRHYRWESGSPDVKASYKAPNATNPARPLAVAVSPDGERVVASFDTSSVAPSPTERYFRITKLKCIDPTEGNGDEPYIKIDGLEEWRAADDSFSAGSTQQFNNLGRRDFEAGASLNIEVKESDFGTDQRLGRSFGITSGAGAAYDGDGNLTRASGYVGSHTVSLVTVDAITHNQIAKYELTYLIWEESETPPSIEELVVWTRSTSSGHLSGRTQRNAPGVSQIDDLVFAEQVDEDGDYNFYGAAYASDRITLHEVGGHNGPLDPAYVADGESQLVAPRSLGANHVSTVLDGDTAYSVSAKYGLLWRSDWNTAQNAFVQVGQVRIPGLLDASDLAVVPRPGLSDHPYLYVLHPTEDAMLKYWWNGSSLVELARYTDGLNAADGLAGASSIAAVGDDLYITSPEENSIAHYSGAESGTPAFQSKNTSSHLDGPTDVVFSSDGGYAYVASTGNDRVLVFSRSSTDGSLSRIQTRTDGADGVSGLGSAFAVALSPDEDFLYVAGGDDTVATFERNASNGRLTFVGHVRNGAGGVRGLQGLSSLAVSGDYLFAAGAEDDQLVVFQRDSATGELTYVQRLRQGGGGVDGLQNVTSLLVHNEHLVAVGGGTDTTAGGLATFDIVAPEDLPEPNIYVAGFDGIEDLDVRSGDNNDRVTVHDVGVTFTLRASEGDDVVAVYDTSADVHIRVGTGHDEITLFGTGDGVSTTLDGYTGDDLFIIAATGDSYVSLNGGSGRDTFRIDATGLGAHIHVDGGGPTSIGDGDTLILDTKDAPTSPARVDGPTLGLVGTVHYFDPTSAAYPGGTLRAIPQPVGVDYDSIEWVSRVGAPIPDAGGLYHISEGEHLNLDGSGSSAPPGTVEYDWDVDGDGSFGDASGANPVLGWEQLWHMGVVDDGIYPMALRVSNEQGSDIATTTLTVANTAPSLVIDEYSPGYQWVPYRLDLGAQDPGDDRVTGYTVNWRDGSPLQSVDGSTASVYHVYAEAGTYEVVVEAEDEDGTYQEAHWADIQASARPTLLLSGSETIDEAAPYDLTLTGISPAAAISRWDVHWGDGSTSAYLGSEGTIRHTYADSGHVHISAVVVYDNGGSIAADNVFTIHVNDVAPAVSFDGPADGDEGDVFRVENISAVDPGDDTITSWIVEWGDGASSYLLVTETSAEHVYTDHGTYTVRVGAIDDEGLHVGPDEAVVHVGNTAPMFTVAGDAAVDEGSSYSLHLAADDPGDDTIAEWEIDWGDGQTDIVRGNPTSATHTYADGPADVAISVIAVDEDGTYDAGGLDVRVRDVAPQPSVTGDASVFEGSPYTLALDVREPGDDPVTGWIVDWGDGAIDDFVGEVASAVHTYADGDSSPFVAATVHQWASDHVAVPWNVSVFNVSPSLEVGGDPEPAVSGALRVFLGAVIDPGDDTVTEYRVDWGDGSVFGSGADPYETFADGGWKEHVFEDDQPYHQVTVTLVDEDGVFPLAGMLKVAEVDAAVPLHLSLLPGTDDRYVVDWGDGTTDVLGNDDLMPIPGGGVVLAEHAYPEPGLYSVALALRRNGGDMVLGGVDGMGRTVLVRDPAPVVEAGPDQLVTEGEIVSLTSAAFADAGGPQGHTATIDWGDGSAVEAALVHQDPAENAGTVSGDHVYADDGAYTVTVTVTDDSGLWGGDTLTVTVQNMAPTVEAGPQQTVDEGSTLSLAPAVFNDPGTADTHTATVDWGDGTPPETGTAVETPFGPPGDAAGADGTVSGAHAYGDNGTYTVTVAVNDDDGAVAADTLPVTVRNVAPVIASLVNSALEVGDAREGDAVELSGTFTDPGWLDTHTASIDWGDGVITAADIAESDGAGSLTADHLYQAGGSYLITVTLADDDGGTDTQTTRAFVTGVGLQDGVLSIVGTSGRDLVHIRRRGKNTYAVHASFLSDRGHQRAYPKDAVKRIEVYLGAGGDGAKVDHMIQVPLFIDAGAGNDWLRAGGGPATFLGGEGDDRLFGGWADDFLDGGSGDDRIWAGPGDDTVLGGAGHDRLYGGPGSDIVDGGAGHDHIWGGFGHDILLGSEGDDWICGGPGDHPL